MFETANKKMKVPWWIAKRPSITGIAGGSCLQAAFQLSMVIAGLQGMSESWETRCRTIGLTQQLGQS